MANQPPTDFDSAQFPTHRDNVRVITASSQQHYHLQRAGWRKGTTVTTVKTITVPVGTVVYLRTSIAGWSGGNPQTTYSFVLARVTGCRRVPTPSGYLPASTKWFETTLELIEDGPSHVERGG